MTDRDDKFRGQIMQSCMRFFAPAAQIPRMSFFYGMLQAHRVGIWDPGSIFSWLYVVSLGEG